ncbi:MAG TPA: protein kinase [Candidatus Dormibacteraeota bacterium]|nr:protein kinase [Candidatus Dormibacteraeota bacterium]
MPELAGIEFVQTIGRGAMGAVYLARQTALNRYVAAKQILGAWNGDPEMLARFQREAHALAQMNHPNVVGIYDLTTAGNDLFMIMEYVRGPSLRQLMDKQQLTVSQALRTLGDISAALEYASKLGVVHRDLKPGNVFVTVAGSSKLGDFGLVKMVSAQSNFQTQAGTILGTPAYMSPEQAEGKADIDQRTDVYSLAVMAYELLTGRLPFPSIPGNIMASLDAHISQPPPKPTDIVPGFPKRVEEALLEGLAKEPKKRPASAGQLWQKIQSAAAKAWPGWEKDSDLAAIALAAAPPAPPPLPAPAAPAAETAMSQPPGAYGAPTDPPPMAPPPPSTGTSPPLSSIPPSMPVMAPPAAPAMAPPPASGGTPPSPGVPPQAPPDETMVRPAAALDETMVRPSPADETVVQPPLPDETMVRPSPADETVVQPPLPDETMVRPPPADETMVHPVPPAPGATPSAPTFAPLPPMSTPASMAPPLATTAPPVAPMSAPPAGPASGSWAAPQVETPVYKPPPTKSRRRGGFGRFLLILVLLLIIVVAGAGAVLFLTGGNLFGPGTPLSVSSVNTTVNPSSGKCPSSKYVFSGKVHTNGAGGDITYQWVKPDGTATDPAVATIKKGDTDAVATLEFTFQGNGSAEGDAVLRVLKPTNLSSQAAHITYTCP